ncbi:MAG: CHASE3 domain-containing protein, partial [Terriglobia bacterium]
MNLARHWANLPLRRKAMAAMALPVASALLIVYLFADLAVERREADSQVQFTFELMRDLEAVLRSNLEAQNAIRGYLLTGDPRALEPFRAATNELSDSLQKLSRPDPDFPRQAQFVERLET